MFKFIKLINEIKIVFHLFRTRHSIDKFNCRNIRCLFPEAMNDCFACNDNSYKKRKKQELSFILYSLSQCPK